MEKHILLVEDEPDIRDAIAEAITSAGYRVSTAENGQVGLSKALSDHPDLILLDLIMPVMDGHETLRRLREDPWGKDAKVIILTAMDDVKNVASAHTGDINDYIIKAHAGLDDIVKKVRMALFSE